MAYKTVPEEFDFSTRFPTWIIAFCPDTNSWFVTNQRFFYYEYPREFSSEADGIKYFKDHINEFINLRNEMCPRNPCVLFLENDNTMYKE